MLPASSQRRSNVRRANVTACMRCKSRKQRCDQSIPSCLNCVAAGVECVNVDINGQVTPRSYIHNLEERIAHLEKQLISRGITDYDSATSIGPRSVVVTDSAATLSPPSHGTTLAKTLSSSQDWSRATGISTISMTTLHHHLATANIPITSDSEHQGVLEGLPYDPQVSLPTREVAYTLIDAYFEHSDFFSPILERRNIDAELSVLYTTKHDSNSPPDLSALSLSARFRVALIFAIAARLLNCKDSSFPISRAEAYYALASRILSMNSSLVQRTGLDQLENLLLLIQYLFFSSNLVSAWYLLGYATRMAIEMGNYRESSVHDGTEHGDRAGDINETIDTDLRADRKRWVFWAVYSFERILCHVLNRPCSIPDEAISTPLPSVFEGGEAYQERCSAIHLIKHLKLSSEIEQTMNQNLPLNGATLDYTAWRDGMWHRLQEWRASVPQCGRSTQLAPSEIFAGCYHNSIIRLYLPSQHMPEPGEYEYIYLAHSAIQAVEIYKNSFKDGKLRFYWRTVHNLFRAGTALVQCLKVLVLPSVLGGELTSSDLKGSINTCSAVLWGMVERYHLGRAYRDTFENISSQILNDKDKLADYSAHAYPDLFMDVYIPPEEFNFNSFV